MLTLPVEATLRGSDLSAESSLSAIGFANDQQGAQRSRSRSRSQRRCCSCSSNQSRSYSSSSSDAACEGVNGTGRERGKIRSESVKISADDAAAFTLLDNGNTLSKVARASLAVLSIDEQNLVLCIQGTSRQRRRARQYADNVMKHRVGRLTITKADDDGDLTVLTVPADVVGYVQGHGGSVLRAIEEEWGTLMFFVDSDVSHPQRLAIFGGVRGRRGSELKVLSAIEIKSPGYFKGVREEVLNRDVGNQKHGIVNWGTSVMSFRDEGELSHALGKQGTTRRKLERSTGAVVQYVGMSAVCSGSKSERSSAKEYMKWLFQQIDGPVYVEDWADRDDCTVVPVPCDCVGYITGIRRAALRAMEEEWGTLMFFMGAAKDKARGRDDERDKCEKLAIFGSERSRLGTELKVMSGVQTKYPGFFTKGVHAKTSSWKGFDTDRVFLVEEEVSYAFGKDGGTRKTIEIASGAILQYVGHVAFIGGTMDERNRCREFIGLLLQLRHGPVTVTDISGRNDVLEMYIPAECLNLVNDNGGSELRRIEAATGTFMFMAVDRRGQERLLIFSVKPGLPACDCGRAHAERLVSELILKEHRDDGISRQGQQPVSS